MRAAAECFEESSSRARQTDPLGASVGGGAEGSAGPAAEAARRWEGGAGAPELDRRRKEEGGEGSEARLALAAASAREEEGGWWARGEGAAAEAGGLAGEREIPPRERTPPFRGETVGGVSRREMREGETSTSLEASAMLTSMMTGDWKAGEDAAVPIALLAALAGRGGVTAALEAVGEEPGFEALRGGTQALPVARGTTTLSSTLTGQDRTGAGATLRQAFPGRTRRTCAHSCWRAGSSHSQRAGAGPASMKSHPLGESALRHASERRFCLRNRLQLSEQEVLRNFLEARGAGLTVTVSFVGLIRVGKLAREPG